jgi:ribosome-binding protein aMBF1 (putative translation factor)
MEDFIPKNIPPERQAILREAWKRRRQKLASMSVEDYMNRLREARMKGYMSEELEKELAARWGWDVDGSHSSDVQPS